MPTPYYDEAGITIYHGDCREVLPTLRDVDLVVTSPPYNLGLNSGFAKHGNKVGKWSGGSLANGYEGHDDAMPHDEYVAWQRSVLRLCWDTLSVDGAIFYNHKSRIQAGNLWMPTDLNPGLPLRQIIVWARSGGINFAHTHYVPTHELILLLAKPDWRLKSKGASGVGDVWMVPQEANPDHPAPFPIGLPARAIETSGPRLVLDPFTGSGTTLRAAKDASVKAVGIEKSERYCEIAATRLGQGVLALESA